MKKRESVEVMARKREDCKRIVLEWAENGRSVDKYALTGEFTSDDAARVLGKARSQVAGYLKQMAEDERSLNRTFKHLRWYYSVNDEPQEEITGYVWPVRDNGIRLGAYFAP